MEKNIKYQYQSLCERTEHDELVEDRLNGQRLLSCNLSSVPKMIHANCFRTAMSTTTPASVIGDAALVPRNVSLQPPLRTLDDVRDQVTQEIAISTITKAEYVDGKKLKYKNFQKFLY